MLPEDEAVLFGAGNRSRTDGLVLGKHSLYQLSYTRIMVEAVRFELTDPFEPSVFKTGAFSQTLPHFHIGVGSQIRTGGFTVLQTVALDHSAIPTLIGGGWEDRTPNSGLQSPRVPISTNPPTIGGPNGSRTRP